MAEQILIAIIGPGNTNNQPNLKLAFQLGKFIAEKGWLLLTGGRNMGIMESANKGAALGNGVTIGILPGDGSEKSEYVNIPIITGMGSARNNILALSANLLIGIGIGPGTASEISLAIKAHKKVIITGVGNNTRNFFYEIGKDRIVFADDFDEIKSILESYFK